LEESKSLCIEFDFCNCIRFAEIEVVAALTAFITRYAIHLTDDMESGFDRLNLSRKEREERLLKGRVLITTT